MYDSVDVAEIPADAPAVAGYVGGHWPTYPSLHGRFPHARRLSIAVNAAEDADCLDVEPGDATPGEVVAWVKRQRDRGVRRPVIYASRDTMPAIIAELDRTGAKRKSYRLWSAHYSVGAHICSRATCGAGFTADATQWTDHALGRNLDESVCGDTFWRAPGPKHPHRRRTRARKLKPHRKVTAAGIGAGISTAVFAFLAHHGVHLTTAELQAIAGAVAVIAGYVTPAPR